MRNTVIESHNGQLMSKTQHYRKVTKPLLERKRRARMNHYLDELKNLIVETMEAQGEHITKLEKADILEMTVTYLKTKNQSIANCNINNTISSSTSVAAAAAAGPINPEKFRAGYTQAAYEVSKVFASVPGLDVDFGTKLMKHLGYKLKDLQPPQQLLSSIALNDSISTRSIPSSPLHNQQKNHQFEFIEKSNNINNNDIDIEVEEHRNNYTMTVITPPQSPNLIQYHHRSSVITPSNFKNIQMNDDSNGRIQSDLIGMEKNVDQQGNQENSGDVWRPW